MEYRLYLKYRCGGNIDIIEERNTPWQKCNDMPISHFIWFFKGMNNQLPYQQQTWFGLTLHHAESEIVDWAIEWK